MYYPSLEEVKRLKGRGNLVPVYREVQADLETPVSAYLKVARPPYSFLLESVEGGERLGRYQLHRDGALQGGEDGTGTARRRGGPANSGGRGDG